MINLKKVLIAAISAAALTATAETVDCVTIVTAEGTQKFAISEIKEITFADDGITVVKTDGAASTFLASWQMKFGQADLFVGDILSDVSLEAPACVYTIDGRMVGSYQHLSDLRLENLAPGTYMIVSNDKIFKIQR